MASTWASKASNELHNLQGLEQELDLQLEEARELKQSLELNLEYDTALLSEMTSEADAPSHGLARCLEKLPQKQGKTAVSNSSRSPVRKEARSRITEKRERDCDNAAGKQVRVTSMQKEETDDTKRQKKLGGGSSSKSSSSSSSSHKPTATVTRPQPSN